MERNEVIKMLESDLESLMKKRTQMITNNDYKSSIEVTRVIKETLSLLETYGWQQMYSIYEIPDEINHGDFIDMIAVWEQNSEGQIRNHRKFQRGIEM